MVRYCDTCATAVTFFTEKEFHRKAEAKLCVAIRREIPSAADRSNRWSHCGHSIHAAAAIDWMNLLAIR
jgi:hypothetical protein